MPSRLACTNESRSSAVSTAIERLNFVHANLLGIVLNQSGQDLEATGGYYYTSPESAPV